MSSGCMLRGVAFGDCRSRRAGHADGGPVRWYRILVFCLGAIPTLGAAQENLPERARIATLREEAVAYEHGNGVPKDGLRAAAGVRGMVGVPCS